MAAGAERPALREARLSADAPRAAGAKRPRLRSVTKRSCAVLRSAATLGPSAVWLSVAAAVSGGRGAPATCVPSTAQAGGFV